MSPYEASAIIAIGWAQQGRIDEALAAVEEVVEHRPDHPFVRATAALCYALAGQPDTALEHARAVGSMSGTTYLDEVFAHIAASSAAWQLGTAADAHTEALAAVERAVAVGDVIATAFAADAFRALTGNAHPAFDRSHLTEGWATVVRGLTPAR
jgi:tetratricopeptide (TPR) repeat protein